MEQTDGDGVASREMGRCTDWIVVRRSELCLGVDLGVKCRDAVVALRVILNSVLLLFII